MRSDLTGRNLEELGQWPAAFDCLPDAPQELVEDVHLGGITIDTVNQHLYWTVAWHWELVQFAAP